jgi:hypothetical protein
MDVQSMMEHGDMYKAELALLDPEIQNWPDGRLDLLWSDRECWTSVDRCLAEYGEAGWELVGTAPLQSDSHDRDFSFLFKRPKT